MLGCFCFGLPDTLEDASSLEIVNTGNDDSTGIEKDSGILVSRMCVVEVNFTQLCVELSCNVVIRDMLWFRAEEQITGKHGRLARLEGADSGSWSSEFLNL